jgi:hypothetical protein
MLAYLINIWRISTMASISIKNLNSTGEDLLLDSEGYLDSLSDELTMVIKGGVNPTKVPSCIILVP